LAVKNYTLNEISKWQQEISGKESKIFLPSLQRGFVWKANQIEALWDSIFRGYPVGAILMSIDSNENRNLLDGQQRCTSIALGHFNPFQDSSIQYLSLKSYKPSIWIDISPQQKANGLKYMFRCLTRSHPWGYVLRDSATTLPMQDRKRALEYFKAKSGVEPIVERYTDLKAKDINPWDAYMPIPLAFLTEIEATTESEFISILLPKLQKLKIKTKHSNNIIVDFTQISQEELKHLYKGYTNYKLLQIPEILVNADVLKEDDESLPQNSEDPTLFVRLNSAGTRISGEELNYSIYKAHFPKVKDLVEMIGASFIAPSKVISIFTRIAACEQNNYAQYQKEFSIQNFRKKISEIEFGNILQNIIENDADQIINNAITILKNEDAEFSNILLKQILISNSDLFFVLLAYLKKYNFNPLTIGDKKRIASSYVYILWFNKDSKKVANSLYKFLFGNESDKSWTNAIDSLIAQNLLLPIVSPELLRSNLENILIRNKIDTDHLTTIKDKNLLSEDLKIILNQNAEENIIYENWNLLINKIYWNKAMLLYVQKEYLNSKFKEFNQFESIEDTNRPWDWDHIYPNSWVYNNKGINPLVRSWVNCIGNFRALSYDDNRSESNNVSPKLRFEIDSNKKESFINSNDFYYWNQIDNGFWRVKDDEQQVTIFLNAIIHRMVNIYENWFKSYYVSEKKEMVEEKKFDIV
jgi:hypothetical protein